MRKITLQEVMQLYNHIQDISECDNGIANKGLLILALQEPYNTYDGEDLYSTDIDKISSITFNIIKNHCMVDGNKRLGIMVMLYMLQIANIKPKFTDDELINLAVSIANGIANRRYIADVIRLHC